MITIEETIKILEDLLTKYDDHKTRQALTDALVAFEEKEERRKDPFNPLNHINHTPVKSPLIYPADQEAEMLIASLKMTDKQKLDLIHKITVMAMEIADSKEYLQAIVDCIDTIYTFESEENNK